MGQVVYTGSISGNHNLNANGSDGVTVYLSQSGAFPSTYKITSATLYLSKFYCYSRSYGIDLYLNGERVNSSEMCGSEVTQKESGGSTSWYSISGTWNLSSSADYENVSAAEIVSRAHSASSTGVMNLRDGCQVKITVEYSEDTGGGGNTGGDDGGNTGGGGVYPPVGAKAAEKVMLSATEVYGGSVKLSWEYPGSMAYLLGMHVEEHVSYDGETWELFSEESIYEDSRVTDLDDGPPYLYEELVWPPLLPRIYKKFRIVSHGKIGYVYSEFSPTLELIRPSIGPYTDDPIIARETHVKAAHMLELQANINVIRKSTGLSEHAFREIAAGRTGLAGWGLDVLELRDAIDEMGFTHEPWIMFDVNTPRADVIEQLRRVVDALW